MPRKRGQSLSVDLARIILDLSIKGKALDSNEIANKLGVGGKEVVRKMVAIDMVGHIKVIKAQDCLEFRDDDCRNDFGGLVKILVKQARLFEEGSARRMYKER